MTPEKPSLADLDTHWLDFGVQHGYVTSYQYMPLVNNWFITDNYGRVHALPNDAYTTEHKAMDHMATWLFGLWLDTNWEKIVGQPRLKQYATPAQEVAAINDELDIYRGVVPTPKGFKGNPGRVKLLMQRLAQLSNS